MRLSDICEAIVDCEHKTAPQGDGYAMSVGTKAIKKGRLELQGAKPVSEDTYVAWTRIHADPTFAEHVARQLLDQTRLSDECKQRSWTSDRKDADLT